MVAFLIIVILLVLLIDSFRLNVGFIHFLYGLSDVLNDIDNFEKEEIRKEDLLDVISELKNGLNDVLKRFKK
jgi:hypothetical protein